MRGAGGSSDHRRKVGKVGDVVDGPEGVLTVEQYLSLASRLVDTLALDLPSFLRSDCRPVNLVVIRVMNTVQGTRCHLTKDRGGLPALSFQWEGGAAGQGPSLLVMADEYTSESMYVWLRRICLIGWV